MQTTSTSRSTRQDDTVRTQSSVSDERSRADYARVDPEAYRVHSALEGYVRGTGLEHTLLERGLVFYEEEPAGAVYESRQPRATP